MPTCSVNELASLEKIESCGEQILCGMAPPDGRSTPFGDFRFKKYLQEHYKYHALTNDLKSKIIGLNTATLFGVDVEATRQELPKDYLSRPTMAYREEGPIPSHHAYGWVPTGP